MSKLLYLSLFFIFIPYNAESANYDKDSLWNVWQDESDADSSRLSALHKYIWNNYLFSQTDSASYFLEIQYDFAEKVNSQKYLAVATNSMGIAKSILGDNNRALEYFKQTLTIDNEIGDLKGVSASLNNMGIIYKEQGNYSKALEVYEKSLELDIWINDLKGQGSAFNNMGILYEYMDDSKRSIESYKKALEIRKKEGDEDGISTCLNNLGVVHHNMKHYEIALSYYQESYAYKDTINDVQGVAISYNNFASLYKDLGQYQRALYFFDKSMVLKRKIGDKKGILKSYSGMASVYYKQGNFRKSIELNNQALEIANKIGVIIEIQEISNTLYKSYKKIGDNAKALDMHELYILMKDSLNNSENQKVLIQKDLEFEYEKEKVVVEKENERKLALAEKEKEKQKIFKYAMGIGLGLVVLFLIFVFNRLKITRQKNIIIEEQKEEVDKAFLILEEKNQEITDSITYAKRIQTAILPSDDQIEKLIPNSFVLYEPKDIIAGDFYWLEPLKDAVLFAVADCTGHGVPGAMVSVVSINALNRSVRELGKHKPGEILDQTRKIVVQEFGNDSSNSNERLNEVKDGMDIALCSLKGSTLEYAGAYNPLWIVRNNEIIEYKADKQPIGLVDNPKDFTTISLELEKGDSIYIFSDGFADQFGGDKGKKYKYKPFKNFLISIQDHSMKEQKQLIQDEFVKWRGDLEQIDDVCMMGLRY